MKIIDVLTSPWAIMPEKLQEIIRIYDAHIRDEKIDIEAAQKQSGKIFQNEYTGYQVIDGVAVIDMEGVIAKRMNMFMQISGGISTQVLAEDFKRALADSQAHSILMVIDSPGGTVDGVQDLANLIYSARGVKPVVALADGMMASGAVWLGTAAEKVYIKDSTTMVGSIGVVLNHVDQSKAEENAGVKVTEIYAGKFKRLVSSHKELSDDGQAYMQGMVDQIYSVFVEDVARNRGTDAATVLEKMADGRIFIGAQIVEAGIADGIMTEEQIIKMLTLRQAQGERGIAGASGRTDSKKIGVAQNQLNTKTGGSKVGDENKVVITAEVIEKEYPAIAQGFIDRGKAQGAESERNRIRGVQDQCLPGHEALIEQLKFDGKTSGPEAAVQILQAEKQVTKKNLDSFVADAPPAAQVSSGDRESEKPKSDEEKLKAEWDSDPKLRKEFGDSFKAYEAAERNIRAGNVRFAPKS